MTLLNFCRIYTCSFHVYGEKNSICNAKSINKIIKYRQENRQEQRQNIDNKENIDKIDKNKTGKFLNAK